MSNRNVKANKKVVEQPLADVQPVQETAGNPDTTQNTSEQPEGGEKELHVQPGQSGGEQTDDKGNTGVDPEIQETATGKEGGGTGVEINSQSTVNSDQSTDGIDDDEKSNAEVPSEPAEKTAQRGRIAADVFENYISRSALYFTSDMIPFFEKNDALKHANSLDNKTVVTVNKE